MRSLLSGLCAALALVPLSGLGAQQRNSAAGGHNAAETNIPSRQRSNYAYLVDERNREGLFSDPVSALRIYQDNLRVAKCIVKLSGKRAADLVGGPGTDDPDYKDLNRGVNGRYKGCAPSSELSGLSPSVMSAGLAEALVARDIVNREGAAEASAKVEPYELAKDEITIDAIARCLVTRSPDLSDRVLLTEPGSPEEKNALQVVYSSSPECGGLQIADKMPSVSQRAFLAQALFLWVRQG